MTAPLKAVPDMESNNSLPEDVLERLADAEKLVAQLKDVIQQKDLQLLQKGEVLQHNTNSIDEEVKVGKIKHDLQEKEKLIGDLQAQLHQAQSEQALQSSTEMKEFVLMKGQLQKNEDLIATLQNQLSQTQAEQAAQEVMEENIASLQKRVVELENEKGALLHNFIELEELKAENEKLSSRITLLETQNRAGEVDGTVCELQEIKNLQQQYLEINEVTELRTLKAQLQEHHEQMKTLQLMNQEFTQENLTCQHELYQLRMEVYALELHEKRMKEHNITAFTDNNQASSETSDPLNGSQNLVYETELLRNQINDSLKEIHQKELKIQQLNSKFFQLLEEKNTLAIQLNDAHQSLCESQYYYSNLFQHCALLESQMQELEELQEIKNLQQQYLEISEVTELRTLKAQLQEHHEQMKTLQLMNQEFTQENLTCQHELYQLRMEVYALELHEKRIKEHNITAFTDNNQASSETSDPLNGSQNLVYETELLRNQINDSLKEIHQKELKIQQLNSKLSQLLEEKNTLTIQLSDANQSLCESQYYYSNLFQHCALLESQMQELEARSPHVDVAPGAPQGMNGASRRSDPEATWEPQPSTSGAQQQLCPTEEVNELRALLEEERDQRLMAENALALAKEQIRWLEQSQWESAWTLITVACGSPEMTSQEAAVAGPRVVLAGSGFFDHSAIPGTECCGLQPSTGDS